MTTLYLSLAMLFHPVNVIELHHIQKGEKMLSINTIIDIESTWNVNEFNETTLCRGLMQISPAVLEEWNTFFPNRRYTPKDLFKPEVNVMIGVWYIKERIKFFLDYYKLEHNIENYMIAYHDGIGNLRKYRNGQRSLGPEMKGYLKKYADRVKKYNLLSMLTPITGCDKISDGKEVG